MRRLDWMMAAVIAVFLAGGVAMLAMGGAIANADAGGNVLVEQLTSPRADSPISVQCPTISLHRR